MCIPNKWELTERLFEKPLFGDPLSLPDAADAFAIEPDLMGPMVHENLPRNARDIHGLADKMDALRDADEMRRGGTHAEADILVAMAPETGNARKPKPEVKFSSLLEHFKERGNVRRRIASGHQEALRREREATTCESDHDVRMRAAGS